MWLQWSVCSISARPRRSRLWDSKAKGVRTQRSVREMTSITLHFCCWAFLGLFNNLVCSWVQISAEHVGAGVCAYVRRLFLGAELWDVGFLTCIFEEFWVHVTISTFFRRLLQCWSLWSQVEKNQESFRDVLWTQLLQGTLWCCPALKIALLWGYAVSWIVELGPVRRVAASPGLQH